MDETNVNLLLGASNGAPDAWRRLDHTYRPFLRSWFRSNGVGPEDVDDLTQEVLVVILAEMRSFKHSGRTGAFRTWLRNICTHRLLGYLRRRRVRGSAVGGTDFQMKINALEESDSLSDDFERQYDYAVLLEMVDGLSEEFAPSTMTAFRRLTFDAASAAEVARELDLSVGAVYIAKSRVLRRLRELSTGVLHDMAM